MSHETVTPFYCMNLTLNNQKQKQVGMRCEQSLKYNYHYCKGSVCQKYQNKDMLTLTAFGVMALFSSKTQTAHMVQNRSRWAESYSLAVQSKGESSLTGVKLFVLNVPLPNLWPSLVDFVLCDQFQQTASFTNRPHLLDQYSNMALRLSRQNCKLFRFLLSLNPQKRLGYKKKTTPNVEVCPESFRAIIEY